MITLVRDAIEFARLVSDVRIKAEFRRKENSVEAVLSLIILDSDSWLLDSAFNSCLSKRIS